MFIFLIILIVKVCDGQTVFKKMFGTFSPDNFELKEINNSNRFILSNHNNFNTYHTLFKIDTIGEPSKTTIQV